MRGEPCLCGDPECPSCFPFGARVYEHDEHDEPLYLNHYRCPCGAEWEDSWSCTCNDRCPDCNKEIEPYESEELSP